MKIYSGGRQNGKTAKLISYAEKYGLVILVHDRQAAEYIENTAHKMGARIRQPITLADLKRVKFIDDAGNKTRACECKSFMPCCWTIPDKWQKEDEDK